MIRVENLIYIGRVFMSWMWISHYLEQMTDSLGLACVLSMIHTWVEKFMVKCMEIG